jgi:multidrug transporter EmrE-like cation transporter
MAYFYLALAIVAEVAATSALKASDEFTVPGTVYLSRRDALIKLLNGVKELNYGKDGQSYLCLIIRTMSNITSIGGILCVVPTTQYRLIDNSYCNYSYKT